MARCAELSSGIKKGLLIPRAFPEICCSFVGHAAALVPSAAACQRNEGCHLAPPLTCRESSRAAAMRGRRAAHRSVPRRVIVRDAAL